MKESKLNFDYTNWEKPPREKLFATTRISKSQGVKTELIKSSPYELRVDTKHNQT